jgi:O-antigen/teichoic acid export membrane protein
MSLIREPATDEYALIALDSTVEAHRRRKRPALAVVTGRLAALNGAIALVGIITGPLQARALGPAGRGELAAILTPFVFLPTLASVGLGSYAGRQVARGNDPGRQLGSLMPLALAIGLLVAVMSPLIAGFLAGGRAVVYTMLVVGLITFPIGMISSMLLDVAIGLEDWPRVMKVRLIPPVIQLVGIPVLFYSGHLTVESAAILSFAAGVLVLLPMLAVWRVSRPLRFDLSEMRAGVSYGSKCWLGGLSNIANARLDQLLMIRLVSSTVLGLYAIAVTLATFFVSPVISAITTAVGPEMSRGARDMTIRLCRLSILGATIVSLGLAAISPFVLRYAFGPAFSPALPMTLLLLVGAIPNAAGAILNTSLSAHGYPGKPARGEGLALVVTVGGLAVALPTLGGIGAALVSVLAYTTQFIYMLISARRIHGGSYREYLVPTHDDGSQIIEIIAAKAGQVRRLLFRTGGLA